MVCDRRLFDPACPCYFYVVEVEVVVAGYASCVPLVAGGHRTDHHFHSSDPRRTRADVGAGGEVVHDLDRVQEDLVVVRGVDHEEEGAVRGEVPWVGPVEVRGEGRAWGDREEARSHSAAVVVPVRVVRVHEIDLRLLRRNNPYQRAEAGGWVPVHGVEEVDRVVDDRVTWEGGAPAYQETRPFAPSLSASADRACSFCFAFSWLRHPFCFASLD